MSIYYNGIYWNDYKEVQDYINFSISGDSDIWWFDLFKRMYPKKFKKALVLNCGDGHVERMLIDKNIIDSAVSIDCSEELLNLAKQEAEKRSLKIHYHKMDVNTADFPEENYDIIINHAACHHIMYIQKVFNKISSILDQDGIFLNYDYVGPHRNQYDHIQWNRVYVCNQKLPSEARQDFFSYPHLPTMIATDLSEAIHSELIVKTFNFFFKNILYKPIGGGIAYPILTHNKNFVLLEPNKQKEILSFIINQDKIYHEKRKNKELFAFFIGKPNKELNQNKIKKILDKEVIREDRARDNGGIYYEKTSFASIYEELERLKIR